MVRMNAQVPMKLDWLRVLGLASTFALVKASTLASTSTSDLIAILVAIPATLLASSWMGVVASSSWMVVVASFVVVVVVASFVVVVVVVVASFVFVVVVASFVFVVVAMFVF